MSIYIGRLNALILLILVLLIPISSPGQTSDAEQFPDDGSIHSLGNGKMCVYEKGIDVVTAYTGPYSSPSFLRLEWIKDAGEYSTSVRKNGTAIWTHTLFSGNTETSDILDFIDAEMPCFVRHIQTESRIAFRVKLEPYVQLIDNSSKLDSMGNVTGRLLIVPPGTKMYQTYVYPRILYSQVIISGNAKIQSIPGSSDFDIICEPGESKLFLIGGPEYPEVMNNMKQILESPPELLLARTAQYWEDFTKGRKDFTTMLPPTTPEREKLLQTIDDVAVLLKTQQSSEGAVLAGYPYPLGYVRDQYGVSRGLLTLGLHQEAKSILDFYWQIWKKYGYIKNAQAIGLEGIFHIHENDEVESTGYLLLQSFELLKATNDKAFIIEISPMLEWAYFSQKKNLVKDMLPFNGDETYIAGGILPRSVLNDGSAESTMLFIESGKKYLDWVTAQKLWPKKMIVENQALVSQVKNNFMDNFWYSDVLWTNNPQRALYATLPRFRHGVCESAGINCLMTKYNGIVWTERNVNNRYVCAACIREEPLPAAEYITYNILSVALSPFYMGFTIVPYEKLTNAVHAIHRDFMPTAEMISRMELCDQKNEIRTVGYDYGFLLTALNKLDMKESQSVYEKTLSVVDEVGSWSEYYLDNKPSGTRCRPWESAINLEALIEFAMKQPLRKQQ